MENHEYQAPGPNDLRSPCPALNSLANHGYLPRDGKDITTSRLIETTYKQFNLGKTVGFILAYGAIIDIGKTKITLDELHTSKLNHSMSLTRTDVELNQDFRKVSPELIDSLISEKDETNKLTRNSFARQFIKRRDQSLKDNSAFHGLGFTKKFQVFGEYSLTLNCLSGSENETGISIDVNTLRSFYQLERFPENWKKSEKTISFRQFLKTNRETKKIQENLDKEKTN
ncbi:12756_t:CDS:2 [Funneliformis geosporum]|uniref:6073_t:CDS:1 n=1 Tax=Funneliformis geosporum TaxID=1117311 RepID=A0A9W4X762_9GLOM|nr:12756_t:CDS:2 [Funneliformis geosporum]CAI2191461.1 6073_t:CDS:2 [Funneliformis geosporum]